jgi:hypothetical protein
MSTIHDGAGAVRSGLHFRGRAWSCDPHGLLFAMVDEHVRQIVGAASP